MRMQELAARSGLPRTRIHHYIREGLLPPARKTAPNAAEYEQAHLERLGLIERLRSGDAVGELSIPEIRRVIEHLAGGADERSAVRLAREGIEPRPEGWPDTTSFAERAGMNADFARELVRAGILEPEGGRLAPADLLVARAALACAEEGIEPSDLAPLADLLRETGRYAEALVEIRASANGSEALSRLCEALLWRAFAD